MAREYQQIRTFGRIPLVLAITILWSACQGPRTHERTIWNDAGENITLTITCTGCPNKESRVYRIGCGLAIGEHHFLRHTDYRITASTLDGRLVYCRDFRDEDLRTVRLTITAGDIQCSP
jgi:hypothetical protein